MNEELITDLAPYIENYDKIKQPFYQVLRQNNTVSATEKELFIEATKAWKAYQASTDGLELNLLISESNLLGVQQKLKSIFNNKVFDALNKSLDTSTLDAGSFSIGLNIEAELIFGFTATIGLAIGVGINKGVSSCEFISVGFTEGIDEGVLLGVQFGLWSNAPADLGGYSFATEAEAGFVVEITAKTVYTAKGSNKILGVTAEIGAGEEDGINEQESYTVVLDSQDLEGFRRTYQPVKNNLLIIESIKCVHPRNDGGGDENEIYFTFQIDQDTTPYYYPTYDYMSVKEDYTWDCGRSIWFDDSIEIRLYDDDGTSGNDEITKDPIKINISNLNSINNPTTYTIKYEERGDHVEYEITATLIANNVTRK